jgi:hypothetical protein
MILYLGGCGEMRRKDFVHSRSSSRVLALAAEPRVLYLCFQVRSMISTLVSRFLSTTYQEDAVEVIPCILKSYILGQQERVHLIIGVLEFSDGYMDEGRKERSML